MLKHTAPFAHCGQRSGEAAIVITLLLPLSGALDPERLPGPEFAPALARRMGNYRVRAGIEARVTLLVPRINTLDAEVGAVRLNVERCDHASSPFRLSISARMSGCGRNHSP
jgi:hypothetical protein